MEEFKPGQVIAPQSASPVPPAEPPTAPDGSPEPERPAEEPEPAPQPAPAPEPAAPADTAAVAPEPASSGAEATGSWQFRQETDPAAPSLQTLPTEDISWTASEFIAHEKSAGWYGLLAVAAVAAAALVYVVTKDKVSTGVVVFAAAVLGFFAGRKPHTLAYNLNGQGLQMGQKVYSFQAFKTFSVDEEGAIVSISFTPHRRFMPALTIYVAPDLEAQVVNFLSSYLPLETRKADMVDSLLKRMRF